ncbi:hypothetical protein A0H81_01288 [Grifola frondosa]|uniref:Homeobox domain-containing protein n=1 Tax=Grifola frondosa TaxID=5627 RepID=A0A1C7MS06_GRIFR|nr:hypothetical protein A0H81_01288 [Grifola frondosa]
MVPSFAAWSQPPTPSAKQSSSSPQERKEQPKKPRHRHSAFQLAALNELYDKNEHPSLEERTSLAERLGMYVMRLFLSLTRLVACQWLISDYHCWCRETKTVNSWFQNKRASSKKRHKGPANPQCELPPISALIASVPAPNAPYPHLDYDDLSEDELIPRLSHSTASDHTQQQQQTLFYAGNPQHKHLFEADNTMPRKARSRPSSAQTEELRKLYDITPHPSKEQREELGDKIGIIQRSIAKKRKEEEEAAYKSEPSKSRTFSPFPPTSGAAHPSLSVPPATGHPSLTALLHVRRSPSLAPSSGHVPNDSRPSSPRASPYRAHATDRVLAATHARPRRTRPEPQQLEALKKLFHRTRTPSIEERGALALEIGMEVGKVTNWFRNLRQTARKRAKKGGVEGDDEDYYDDMEHDVDEDNVSLATHPGQSRSVSRTGTPAHSAGTQPSPLMHDQDVSMDQDADDYKVKVELDAKFNVKLEVQDKHRMYAHASHSHSHSDMSSDEELQEAVTPSPVSSPPPPAMSRPITNTFRNILAVDPLSYAELEKATARFHTGVRVEDALLLLSFHHHVVH